LRFLFITSSNLACNPRLLKELKLCDDQGFQTTVVQFKLGNWSDQKTEELKQIFFKTKFIEISALRSPYLNWLIGSLIEKALIMIPSIILNPRLLGYSLSKRAFLLDQVLKKVNEKYDWVIAHNPPTFFSAVKFSENNNSCLGIDVEDYHPGEYLNNKFTSRMLKLMRKTLVKANYCSFASPLIQREVFEKITHKINNPLIIINGFNEMDFQNKEFISGNLKIVWFSQNIAFGRGLELFIDQIQDFNGEIELTLIGDLNKKFATEFLLDKNFVNIKPPMSQSALHFEMSNYDIGLACDYPVNRNREIALTNKIIVYVQAGLWLLAINTPAQEQFIEDEGFFGSLVSYNRVEISKELNQLIKIKKYGNFKRLEQFKKGSSLSWEKISLPLVDIWKNH
jgi:glycosyltransferase involved in cell wall biosynthesis